MFTKPILDKFPTYLKIMTFGLLIVFCMIIVLILGMLIAVPIFGPEALSDMSQMANSSDSAMIAMAKYFQIISQLAIFIIPSILFAFLAGRNSWTYLKVAQKPKISLLFYAGLTIIAAIPIINFLGELNQGISLPESLRGIEAWMLDSENQAKQLTEMFLNVNTTGALLINILMIGIIPAIGEEFLFRGILQRLFHEWIKNIHVAIFLSAFLFSFIHFQFYGFLPRFAMGLALGYMFYWSGSLWVPILVHFVNNTLAVLIYYFTNMDGFGKTYETIGTKDSPLWPLAISFILAGFFYWKIYLSHKLQKDNYKSNTISDQS